MSMEDREIELLYDSSIFEKDLKSCGIQLTRRQIRQFQDYYEMLVETNKVMNLTGITEFHEVMKKHFVDSVLLNRVVDIKSIRTVMDVGTGAGFPGIPHLPDAKAGSARRNSSGRESKASPQSHKAQTGPAVCSERQR